MWMYLINEIKGFKIKSKIEDRERDKGAKIINNLKHAKVKSSEETRPLHLAHVWL